MRRHPLLLALTCVLTLMACDSDEPCKLSLDEYEGPQGEALVRHLIKTLPPIAPEVPKVYTAVKGPRLKSTSTAFVRRMADLKVAFVSGEVLTMREPDKSIVDPRSGLSPVTLQIDELRVAGDGKWSALGGWAWKKTYERRRYSIHQTPSGYEVRDGERIEGNYAAPLAQ
ncbi:MAG: hypothetical protein ACOYMN_00120 [Roseimicrobium sp.]